MLKLNVCFMHFQEHVTSLFIKAQGSEFWKCETHLCLQLLQNENWDRGMHGELLSFSDFKEDIVSYCLYCTLKLEDHFWVDSMLLGKGKIVNIRN